MHSQPDNIENAVAAFLKSLFFVPLGLLSEVVGEPIISCQIFQSQPVGPT